MHTQAANKLGFKEDEGIVAFGAGAVNNTLLALMSQVSSNLSLVSRYADDIEKDGVTLHHRGDEYVVPAGDIKLPQTSVIKELGAKIASPRIVLNGRQLGGDYDEIFDSMGPSTEFVVTAQNGPSARMLADAAQKYVERHPEKKAIIENVVGARAASFVSSARRRLPVVASTASRWPCARRDGVEATTDAIDATPSPRRRRTHASKRHTQDAYQKHAGIDAAMFVKMSATDTRAATVLQPGAKWVFGAYELLGGGGVALNQEVSTETLEKAQNFTEWFKLLDATDAGAEDTHVTLRPEAVSGKLAKTANNIGGNYGAAIVTKVVQHHAELNGKRLEGPLPYGVLHPDFDVEGAFGELVGKDRLGVVKDQIAAARDMSLAAVGEYHDVHEELFEDVGINKASVLDAAKLYWTELDEAGKRIPSNHPPTHALAVFERRPSEPLLEDVIDAVGVCQTPEMRALLSAFRRVEGDNEPLSNDFKWNEERSWLETPEVRGAASHTNLSLTRSRRWRLHGTTSPRRRRRGRAVAAMASSRHRVAATPSS
jgi:hypothetical protein